MSVPPPIRLEHRDVFINLPVADLTAMRDFYRALGWHFLGDTSDDHSASFEIGTHLVLVLRDNDSFAERYGRETAGREATGQGINTISAGKERDVKELARRARQAGGHITREPEARRAGYRAVFQDPEGNAWEVAHRNPTTLG